MVGVDEVGRGCIAGPLLVVAARASSALPTSIKDSKLLTPLQREHIYSALIDICEYGEGWVTCVEIDKLGLAHALRLGVKRALKNVQANEQEPIIIDGPINYAPVKYINTQTLIDADSLIPLVSAASIIAKVKRDRYMVALAEKYPEYSFETNVGYGTPKHLAILRRLGPLELVHRLSFAPLRQTSLW